MYAGTYGELSAHFYCTFARLVKEKSLWRSLCARCHARPGRKKVNENARLRYQPFFAGRAALTWMSWSTLLQQCSQRCIGLIYKRKAWICPGGTAYAMTCRATGLEGSFRTCHPGRRRCRGFPVVAISLPRHPRRRPTPQAPGGSADDTGGLLFLVIPAPALTRLIPPGPSPRGRSADGLAR